MRALIATGTGRYADPWHSFPATSGRIAEVLERAGFDVATDDDVDHAMTVLAGVDLLVVNAGGATIPARGIARDLGLYRALTAFSAARVRVGVSMPRRTTGMPAAAGAAALAAGAAGLAATRRVRASAWPDGGSALVTGASRGLGLLIARDLAQRGFRLGICARDAAELDAARRDLTAMGAEVVTVRCDMADRAEVDDLVRSVVDRFGGIDVLVNNAGIIEVAPVTAMTVDDFAAAHGVMFWGTVYPTLAALPHMVAARRGRIINITSIGGKISPPHLLPYNCAKFAAVGLSEGLCAELSGSGITVTTVVPGLMRTGSHLRAMFKGDPHKEFAWFAVAASLPGLSMDARRAARRVVRAGLAGRAEIVLTPTAKLAVPVHGLFPGATARVLGLAGRFLPRATGTTPRPVPGQIASAELNSGLLAAVTTLGRSAARRLHQDVDAAGPRP